MILNMIKYKLSKVSIILFCVVLGGLLCNTVQGAANYSDYTVFSRYSNWTLSSMPDEKDQFIQEPRKGPSVHRSTLGVMVNPMPSLLSKRDTSVCYGQTVLLSDLITTFADTTAVFYTAATGGSVVTSVTPLLTTKYYIHVTNNTTHCESWDSLTVNILALPQQTDILVLNSSKNPVCLYGNAVLSAITSAGNIDVYWYTNDFNQPLASGLTYTTGALVSDTVFYALAHNTVTGCVATIADTTAIAIKIQLAQLVYETAAACQNTPFVWKGKPIPTDIPGNYTYYDSLQNVNGCDSVHELSFEVLELPVITDFSYTTEVFDGALVLSPVTLSASPSDYKNYKFILNNANIYNGVNSDVTVMSPLYYNKEANRAKVIVTDKDACVNSDSITFDLNVKIPNAFQPDMDGYNDYFLKGVDLKIFNRYGHVLYIGRDGWDGKYKGKDMPAGTYFYEIKLSTGDNTTETFAGSVLLERK